MAALACVLAYLLGGIPSAYLLVRALAGVDVRTVGSGNIGATNAARAFTGGARIAVFAAIYLIDFAKGFVPAWCFPRWFGLDGAAMPAVLGTCAVLGHVLTPYLRFKGGKGVATACGVIAALDWIALVVALLVFGAVFLVARRVFVGSLALGLALPIAAIAHAPHNAFGARLPVTLFCFAIAALLFWTHRRNIKKALAERTAGALP